MNESFEDSNNSNEGLTSYGMLRSTKKLLSRVGQEADALPRYILLSKGYEQWPTNTTTVPVISIRDRNDDSTKTSVSPLPTEIRPNETLETSVTASKSTGNGGVINMENGDLGESSHYVANPPMERTVNHRSPVTVPKKLMKLVGRAVKDWGMINDV